MRPVVKNRIAVFHPQGFIDSSNSLMIITQQDVLATLQLDVDAVLISLEKVIFFNSNGMAFLIDTLKQIKDKKKNGLIIGFCNYKEKIYNSFFKMFDEIDFSLYKSLDIANLFVGVANTSKESNILVWHEDNAQRNAMVVSLFERGFNAVTAKDIIDYEKKKKSVDIYTYMIDSTYIGLSSDKVASHQKGNAVIYNLNGFIDDSIYTNFDDGYHQNCLTVGFKVFIFDMTAVLSMNIHGMKFFSKLSIIATEYNARIAVVGLDLTKVGQNFKQDLEDSGISFFKTMELLYEDAEIVKEMNNTASTENTNKKNARGLTKVLVSKLPIFIDAAVETMMTLTGADAQKESASITLFNIEDNGRDLMASSIGFYGDVDGMIVLVFPMAIAKKACMLLLGEELEDREELQDALSEFVNIIGGRAKSLLAERTKTKIKITIPRTFGSIEDVKSTIGKKKGALVNLKFNKYPFYLFLTR